MIRRSSGTCARLGSERGCSDACGDVDQKNDGGKKENVLGFFSNLRERQCYKLSNGTPH